MEILVFSNSRNIRGVFKTTRKSGEFSPPDFYPRDHFAKAVKIAEPGTLVYLDLSGLGIDAARKHIRVLAKNEEIFYGIIDPMGRVKDVAELFHDGAVDYLDREAAKTGVSAKRLKKLHAYLQRAGGELMRQEEDQPVSRTWLAARGKDWDEIEPGKEYLFCLMFIELDGQKEMERKYGNKNLDRALSSFKQYINNSVSAYNGRIWMWSRFGGLVLFPLNLVKSDPIRCGFRLMLFKHLYDIERSVFPNFISLRIVLHVGSTLYTTRNTGQVISDSINSIFHLGHQFARPNNFYITEEVLQICHAAFTEYFVEEGVFEGRNTYRMRRPIHSGSR